MCLNCESYVALCEQPECIATADRFDRFEGRLVRAALWRGYDEPCEHIKAKLPDWRDHMDRD